MDASVSVKYDSIQNNIVVLAYDPHGSRGWQSVEIPVKDGGIIVKTLSSKKDVSKSLYLLQTGAGMVEISKFES